MRAVLLASATATTRLGRRWRSPITHGSALVAFERSKLALAPLIRSRRKYWLLRSLMSRIRYPDRVATQGDESIIYFSIRSLVGSRICERLLLSNFIATNCKRCHCAPRFTV